MQFHVPLLSLAGIAAVVGAMVYGANRQSSTIASERPASVAQAETARPHAHPFIRYSLFMAAYSVIRGGEILNVAVRRASIVVLTALCPLTMGIRY